MNAANQRCLGGGGVDGAIHRAAGPSLRAECLQLPQQPPGSEVRCPTGTAVITGGGHLAAKHVIHTVGPIYVSPAESAPLLYGAFASSLDLAYSNALKSIAFPAISCGIYGYPADEAPGVALDALQAVAAANAGGSVESVAMILFEDHLFAAFVRAAEQRLPRAGNDNGPGGTAPPRAYTA